MNSITYNLALLALDAAALYWVYRRKTPAAWLLAGVVLGGLSLAAVLGFASHHFAIARLAAYAVFLHAPLYLLASAAILFRSARRTALASGALALVGLAIAVDAFWIEPTWLEVTRLRIASPKVPRPIRIVVIADLQTEGFGDYERGVLRRVMEEKPDLVLFAGDYVQIEHGDDRQIRAAIDDVNACLRELKFSAPLGMYAVQGNVDDAVDWPEMFRGLDVRLTRQPGQPGPAELSRSWDAGPLRVTCLSLRDSYNRHLRQAAPGDKFHIVIGHIPNFAMGEVEGDLLIAGHTHGGQVHIPFLGPAVTNCAAPRRMAGGACPLPGGRLLYVPRGIGMERWGAPRMRFLCRPELTVIELVPEGTGG